MSPKKDDDHDDDSDVVVDDDGDDDEDDVVDDDIPHKMLFVLQVKCPCCHGHGHEVHRPATATEPEHYECCPVCRGDGDKT